ncbi:MAG: CD225/dispanin family protein [Candidatus Limisoma sp.]|nr:CD225/dispanin family protein [Bacteroidales bacterium]MDY5894619.1 CD225/dispanin family protein [Candidatus Limisoma sp.]
MQYWIIKDGESKGPFTLEELQAMGISQTTKIWCKGMDNWTKAGETDIADVLFAHVVDESEERSAESAEAPESEELSAESAETPENEELSAESAEASESEERSAESAEASESEERSAESAEASEQPRMTPPPYNPALYSQPPYMPQQPPMPGYRPQPSPQQIYNDGYRRGLEDGKKLDADTDTSKCPPSNMVWAVLATVFCCMPAGIVSIVYASRVSGLYHKGDFVGAKRASDRAAYWALGSAIFHMVTYPITSALSLLMM